MFGFFYTAVVLVIVAAFYNKNLIRKNDAVGAFFILWCIGVAATVVMDADTRQLEKESAAVSEEVKKKVEEDKTPKVFSKTDDGCVVYRFFDLGRHHYFTRCSKETVTTIGQYRNHKKVRTEEITTN